MKKRDIFFIAFFCFLIAISFLFDIRIIKIVEKLRNPFLDYFFLIISFFDNFFIIIFFLSLIFFYNNKKRWILPILFSGIFSVVSAFFLKIIFKRPRPFQLGIISLPAVMFYLIKNSYNVWNFSFPSFETMLVFSMLPIINLEFRKLKKFWLCFAIIVALSRIYFGMHYLSDVLSGILIGCFIGYLNVYLEKKYFFGKKFAERFLR